jgi:hypothetical protein
VATEAASPHHQMEKTIWFSHIARCLHVQTIFAILLQEGNVKSGHSP